MKKLLVFLLLFLFPLSHIEAFYCNYKEYEEVRKQASNVNIMTEYREEDVAYFKITIYNLLESQYVVDRNSGVTYYPTDGLIILDNITEASVNTFDVYSTLNTCDNKPLSILYSTIPSYNKYYKDDLCKGIENYKLCQRWSSIDMTYDDFKKNILEYKYSLIKKDLDIVDDYKSIFDYMMEFYLEYYYYLLPTVIIGLLAIIVVLKKRENKLGI